MAKRHDRELDGRVYLQPDGERAMRHCIEVRHDSFLVPGFFEQLRRFRVAFVFADTAGKWPYREDFTSDFVYVRLHGDEELYVSGYTEAALQDWAGRIRSWAEGKPRAGAPLITPAQSAPISEIYVYFDNDAKVKAPGDARRLAQILDVGPVAPPKVEAEQGWLKLPSP